MNRPVIPGGPWGPGGPGLPGLDGPGGPGGPVSVAVNSVSWSAKFKIMFIWFFVFGSIDHCNCKKLCSKYEILLNLPLKTAAHMSLTSVSVKLRPWNYNKQ